MGKRGRIKGRKRGRAKVRKRGSIKKEGLRVGKIGEGLRV